MVVNIEVPEQFRGPLDLLLYLIKRDEIEIHDIPISHITNEFIKVMGGLKSLDVDTGAEFANMAAMLMEIKSRMLLPPEEVEDDEETVELDPRSGLVEALLEYKRFKEAAGELGARYERHQDRFARLAPADLPQPTTAADGLEASVDELYFAFLKMMDQVQAPVADTIVATELTTEEALEDIEGRLRAKARIPFQELFPDAPDRHTMVVYFVALLELIRLRRLRAYQASTFGEIFLEERPAEAHALSLDRYRLQRPVRRHRQTGRRRRGGILRLSQRRRNPTASLPSVRPGVTRTFLASAPRCPVPAAGKQRRSTAAAGFPPLLSVRRSPSARRNPRRGFLALPRGPRPLPNVPPAPVPLRTEKAPPRLATPRPASRPAPPVPTRSQKRPPTPPKSLFRLSRECAPGPAARAPRQARGFLSAPRPRRASGGPHRLASRRATFP